MSPASRSASKPRSSVPRRATDPGASATAGATRPGCLCTQAGSHPEAPRRSRRCGATPRRTVRPARGRRRSGTAAARRRVVVLPFVTSTRQFATVLASADVFVHAGDQETFGLSVLEAMACGTPAVLRDAEGLAELADGDRRGRGARRRRRRFRRVDRDPLRRRSRRAIACRAPAPPERATGSASCRPRRLLPAPGRRARDPDDGGPRVPPLS